jgi:two-component system, cell cycle sensor histidine kinase and response regulator CckA
MLSAEKRLLAEQVRQVQQLGAVVQVSRGLAHDLNNMLTALTGNITLLLGQLAEGDASRPALMTVNQLAWKAADLTRKLLECSRQETAAVQPINCNDTLWETVELLRPIVDDGVTVLIHAAADLWQIEADPAQLARALVSLCIHLRDARPAGGVITLETTNVALDEDASRQQTSARPGEFVRLRIANSGPPISADVLARLVDADVTSREDVELGLAMVKETLKQHRGWIECTSQANQGTQCDIYLPRFQEQQEGPGSSAGVARPPHQAGPLPAAHQSVAGGARTTRLRRGVARLQ